MGLCVVCSFPGVWGTSGAHKNTNTRSSRRRTRGGTGKARGQVSGEEDTQVERASWFSCCMALLGVEGDSSSGDSQSVQRMRQQQTEGVVQGMGGAPVHTFCHSQSPQHNSAAAMRRAGSKTTLHLSLSLSLSLSGAGGCAFHATCTSVSSLDGLVLCVDSSEC